MFKAFKIMNLSGALKAKGNAQEAYSAVLELGRIGNEKAVDLLITALTRRDGVARSAARELGKLKSERALQPLTDLLGDPEVRSAAADALLGYGPVAVGPLVQVLSRGNGNARESAALALGELRDKRAVESLIQILQTDEVYSVRIAAATALGKIKDARAIWVLVQTLQLRDETTPERQVSLDLLRQATHLAMRKIGDPLAAPRPLTVAALAQEEVRKREQEHILEDTTIHPRLINDVKLWTNEELVETAQELVTASEEISWASLESREPMLASYLKTYEQRAQLAEIVGRELHRRGGSTLLKRVHTEQLGNNSVIGNWWSGLLGGQ